MNRLHQFRRVHWPRPLSYVPTECVVTFPKPSADDPDALLLAVIADFEGGLDQSCVPPPNGLEHAAVALHWRGGSVCRFPCIADAILDRDLLAKRN